MVLDVMPLCHMIEYESRTVFEGQGHLIKIPITANYTACSVKNLDKMG